MEEKRVLIIGAGIGGLSLAIKLKMPGISFRIIEKQKLWEIKGLAMSIQGQGIKSASSMGILEEIQKHGKSRNLQKIEDSNGRVLKKLIKNLSDDSFIIQRDTLHKSLRNRVPEVEMNLSVTKKVEINNKIYVSFSDGSSDYFDLVVGADGVNSEVLNTSAENPVYRTGTSPIIYSGTAIWGIKTNIEYKRIFEVWDQKGVCALYPVENGTVFSFIKKVPISFSSSREERASHIKKYFSSFNQDLIKDTLKNLPDEIFFDHIRYTRPEKWNRGRITLLGDACHSMSPLSGMGANLAMTDAVGLAEVIKRSDSIDDLQAELEFFNSIRKKEADRAYQLSRLRTRRALMNFPLNLIRNYKMKKSDWNY